MIETLKDITHAKGGTHHDSGHSERTATHSLHRMDMKESEDSLESTRARVLSNAKAIYGSTRDLDVISFAPTSSRRIGAAIVEHQPTGRSYIHCTSAKEDSRLAAMEHLLVITEDILARLLDAEGITSSGWLPATSQAAHAAAYNAASLAAASTSSGSVPTSVAPSVAESVSASRRSSVQPLDSYGAELSHASSHGHNPGHGYHHHQHNQHAAQPQAPVPMSSNSTPLNPLAMQIYQGPPLLRNNSESHIPMLPPSNTVIPRTNSDFIAQPRPVPVGQYQPLGQQGQRHPSGKVQWNLGPEKSDS